MQVDANMTVEYSRRLRDTGRLRYESVRLSNGVTCVIAHGETVELASVLRKLQAARQRFFTNATQLDLNCRNRDRPCPHLESCLKIDFFPRIVNTGQVDSGQPLILDFECFKVGGLMMARDLVKDYYVDLSTARRLAAGIMTLVDRLTRWQIALEISLDNLLIDPDTAMITLLDWSTAKVEQVLPLEWRLRYQAQLADLIFALTETQSSAKNGTISSALGEEATESEFFQALQAAQKRYRTFLAARKAVEMQPEMALNFLDFVQKLDLEHEKSSRKILNCN